MKMDFNERLAMARKKAGFPSAREAAKEFLWNENTYKSHENGMRGKPDRPPEQEVVRKYARAFNVDYVWLLTGEGTLKGKNLVKVVGRIGAGAKIMPEIEQVPPEGFYDVEVPFAATEDMIAFEVMGDSMFPRYDEGDVIICEVKGIDPATQDGQEAAVRTADGTRYLKRLHKADDGTFDLESHNAPLIRGVTIEWCGEILARIPRRKWRKVNGHKPVARR